MIRVDRRRFLRGAAAAAALPALEAFRPRVARAEGSGTAPKRVIVVHQPQGTVMEHFVPTGVEDAFTLPYILEPLAPFIDRGIVLTGLDNLPSRRNAIGNAHQNANFTCWTGTNFARQDVATPAAGGPSVEQVIAERIGADTPFPRIDLCAGGSVSNGVYAPAEGAYFWHGANDPVAFYNDPLVAMLRIFGDSTVRPEDAWAQRSRRSAVLAGVMDGFGPLRSRVGYEDRVRLDAHLDKVASLEQRIRTGLGTCASPQLDIPTGMDASRDDDLTTPLYNDLIVAALACDLTRVATFHYANAHSPTFPWLWADNGGPIVPSTFENWHAMVHADYQPGMERVYRWYQEMLADLLGKLATTTDADGDNLLETTLVVCASEFSSGRHLTRAIPAMLFGHTGPFARGRWIDHMATSVEAYRGSGAWEDSGVTTNQLLVSMLHAFGFDDERFGMDDEEIPEGGVPGL